MTTPGLPVDSLFVAFQVALTGRYSLDREIGRGGMGVVYLAHEVHLDRPVAIKLLPPERASDPALRERFLREARNAAKLSHPNIIPIHAVDEIGQFVYYVMAYVEGETLAERVRTRGPLSNAEATRVIRDVAWALAHAHTQGLVHRDVKPDNILIEAGTGRVLVADFGIAAVTSDATGDGISGTPEFMSPEQALGTKIDGRSDLYSLGATAFFSLTGRLPFEGVTATEVLAKQVTEPAPSVLSMSVPVSRKLAVLVDRCLAKDPAQRPVTAEALAEQLGVAIEQRKELPVALKTFAKRHARLDGAGSALVPIASLAGSVELATLYQSTWAGVAVLGVGFVVIPAVYTVLVAREIMQMGFTHADVVPAFRAEVEQGREERAIEAWRGESRLERVLTAAAIVSGGMFASAIAIAVQIRPWLDSITLNAVVIWNYLTWGTWGLGAVTGLSLSTRLYLWQRRRDIDSEFWEWLWSGRIGKWAFATAKRLLRGKRIATVMTHRATELALGMAAENLFESLPRETRESLRELPVILRRLQEDAQRLRAQYNELQEALSEAPDGGASDAYAEVRETRDAIHAKLTEAVGALETIRLNLLRLHAGSATVEGLTTHLNIAADVSAEVERLLAAREEIERHLEFPREIATTPV
ncbi:MAG TPA: protein kinase [Gemmatimonadaceae bacterium]